MRVVSAHSRTTRMPSTQAQVVLCLLAQRNTFDMGRAAVLLAVLGMVVLSLSATTAAAIPHRRMLSELLRSLRPLTPVR